MGREFGKALIVFIGFILILVVILIALILRYAAHGSIMETYDSIIEKIEMIDFMGIFLAFMGATVLNLVSVVLTFNLARTWAKEQPELAEDIFRFAKIISITLIIVIGGLAGGLIVLRFLWTIGYF